MIVMAVVLAVTACTPATESKAPADNSGNAAEQPAASNEQAAPSEKLVHSNADDFDYIEGPGTVFDINTYYKNVGIDCDVTLLSTGGTVRVPDHMTSPMPQAKEAYTVGFSVYYTVDEYGAILLESMKDAAVASGINLLVHDANYDQNAQNQAVEQWILAGVDGVIVAPCDFTGVKGTLDELQDAGIPYVTFNPPLAGATYAVQSCDFIEQGRIAGEMLRDAIIAEGKDMNGVVVYQNLPFVHPNAATRWDGFNSVFKEFPDVEIIELTGISPEEHYVAFEGAMSAYPDMLGAWALYDSAAVGMMNAKKAANRNDIILSAIDPDQQILKGIYEGDIVGTVCFSPIGQAYWTMSQLVNLMHGVDIPAMVYLPNRKVTTENVAEAFEYYHPGKTLQGYLDGKY